ncbi:hypothetical protein PR048_000401 [Dryococelus australis]|uniref:FH2 domain-containing protein n=1 Tax=Dryococelus australis TaxID=614101 RepID=A0ABQ9IEJ6_9NEOP|nr:hypothetical protein PR048_000401 [Dryococelus australis]
MKNALICIFPAGESVWTDAVRSNSMIAQIDFKRMEELFCQKKAVAYSRRVSAPARLSSEPKVQILDCKRNFSINIFLKQFKQYKGMGEAAGVVDMILNVRSKEIGIDGLRNLLKLLPTKEEVCM